MNIEDLLLISDQGHGGTDKANRGPTGYIEADGVLDIGLRFRKLLNDAGYNVKMTREKDETVALYARAEMANRWKGNFFISLHTNAGPETAHGIETFYTLNNEWGNKQHHTEAKRVAAIIQKSLVEATGLRDRGIKTRLVDNPSSPIDKKDYYAVIRRSNMPAIIVEMGFHTNRQEEALLKTTAFREKLAQALLQGIKEAYPMNPTNTPQVENKVEAEDRKIKLNIHGKLTEVDGLFKAGRNYVPIIFLEQLGYNVIWKNETKIVEISYKK